MTTLLEKLRDPRFTGQEAMRESAAQRIERLQEALAEAIAYADAAAREDGMPEGKQCRRLSIKEVQLLGKPASQNRTVEWDVAACRATLNAEP